MSSTLFTLILIVMIIAGHWPPAIQRAYAQPEPPDKVTPQAQAQTPGSVFLPLMATIPGLPNFVITSPTDGLTVAGTSIFAVQVVDPGTVSSVTFKAGSQEFLELISTDADGFQTYLDAKTLPAGLLQLSAIAKGPSGEATKTINVTVVPNPPSSAVVDANGTTLGTSSGATLIIPPGAVDGNANISIRERSQAEVTAESGIKWDDLGVTFLGDIKLQSDKPLQKPTSINTVGYANRIQPGQAVVTYNLLPDQDGDGVGELVVASSAQVATNGTIVGTPTSKLQVEPIGVSPLSLQTQDLVSTTAARAGTLVGKPGEVLTLRVNNLNPLSLGGNKVTISSNVNGRTYIFDVDVTKGGFGSSQTVQIIIPPLPPGPSQLVFTNLSTGETTAPIALTINDLPPLTVSPLIIIDDYLEATERQFTPYLTDADSDAETSAKIISDVRRARDELSKINLNTMSPSEREELDRTAAFIVNTNVLVPALSKSIITSSRIDVSIRSGLYVLDIIGTAMQFFPPTLAEGELLSRIAGLGQLALDLCQLRSSSGNCFDDPPPPPPPPCQPSANGGGTPASRGIGSAPPPGGNSCGNVNGQSSGGSKQSLRTSRSLQQTALGGLEPGRYIIKIYPRAGGRLLSPFTGANDAGGYFFVPFIPKGEEFRAVALDKVTGATKTFDGVGPEVGKSVYMFFDFSDAEDSRFPIALDDTVSDGVPSAGAGNIENPGALDIYKFTTEAGRDVIFDVLNEASSLSGTRWKLEDSAGQEVFERNLDDTGVISLVKGGEYTLTVGDDNSGGTGTYSFKLIGIPLPNSFNITIGDTVSNGTPGAGAGNIESAYVKDIYTFTATAGQQVYFGLLNQSNGMSLVDWRLLNSADVEVFSTCFGCGAVGVKTLVRGGAYRLIVGDDRVPATGTYSFQLWNVPPPQQFTITIGDTVSDGVPAAGAGNIETPGVQDIYTFTALSGQVVYFDELNTVDCIPPIDWKVMDSAGDLVFNTQGLGISRCGGADAGRFTLSRGGTYTITVEGAGQGTGTYSFKIWNVPTPQQFTIAIGYTVSDGVPGVGAGNIETPGVQDIYTFTALSGQVVYFDELNTVDCISPVNWKVTDSAGDLVFNTQGLGISGCGAVDAGQFTLTRGGTYTITVEGAGQGTGTYSFKIWNVPAPQQFTIAIGDTVSDGAPGAGAGNIETPGVQDIYTFTAASGQVVYFDELNVVNCLSSIQWRVTDSAGEVVFGTQHLGTSGCGEADAGQFTLTRGGTYTITVEGAGPGTGTYSFKLQNV